MDSCDILLGRPWMYDKNGTNGMRDNTYTFMHGEKQVTLSYEAGTTKERVKFSSHQRSASSAHYL